MRTRPARSSDLRWLEDAWRRLTHTLPIPAEAGLRDAAAFVEGVVPRGRDSAAVVWLLAWRMMPRARPPFPGSFWIHATLSEVYCYFNGRGYGQRRVIQLLERWARWLHASGELATEAMEDLLGDLDHAREASGYARKRAARPRVFHPMISIEHTVRPLFPDPGERRWAAIALQATLAFLDEVQGRPGRLHALDPEAFALDLRAMLEGGEDPNHRAPAKVLGTTATLYRELAGSDALPAPVVTALADRLERLALGCR